MKPIHSLNIMFFSVFFLATSCKKFEKIDFTEAWNPDLAIPLAHTNFSVYDVLARVDTADLIVNDPISGSLSLVYNSLIASLKAEDLYGNISFNENLTYTTPALNLPIVANYTGSTSSSRAEILNFTSPNNEELDHIFFKGGFFNFSITTNIRQNISLKVTFPKLLNGSTPVTRDLVLNYQGSTPMNASFQIDLTELKADFTLNGTDHNKLEAKIDATITGDGSQGISGSETLNLNISSDKLAFHNIDGYFGQGPILQQSDSVLIRIYQNTDQVGHFELKNPQVIFTVDNSFGIPVDLHFNNLKTINSVSGQEFLLTDFPTPLSITAPTVVGNETKSTLVLDSSNTGNLGKIISPTPKYFYYEANAIPNPQGKTGLRNFVDETSKLEIRADVNLPLEGYMYGFFVQDTVPFNLTQSTENIESVLFRLIADNGFPVDVSPQITALDDNYTTLFTLFAMNDKILEGAPVDNNGKVTNAIKKVTDINLSPDKMAQLKKVKHLIIRAETNSTGYNASNPDASTNVKFYEDYSLKLQLSMNIKYQSN